MLKAKEITLPIHIIPGVRPRLLRAILAYILSFHGSIKRDSELASRPGGHPPRPLVRLPPRVQIEAAAEMFRALGDPERLRLLVRLAAGEACVSELAEDEGEKITS